MINISIQIKKDNILPYDINAAKHIITKNFGVDDQNIKYDIIERKNKFGNNIIEQEKNVGIKNSDVKNSGIKNSGIKKFSGGLINKFLDMFRNSVDNNPVDEILKRDDLNFDEDIIYFYFNTEDDIIEQNLFDIIDKTKKQLEGILGIKRGSYRINISGIF